MDREQIIDTLAMLYSRRVKSLIGNNDDDFIRELIELMFIRFDEIDEMPGYSMYAKNMNKLISDILEFNSNMSNAENSVRELTNRLEEYIKLNIAVFWPNIEFKQSKSQAKEEKKKQDYRAFVGNKFRTMVEDKTGKYKLPIEMDNNVSRNIYKQLCHVTEVRNDNTHIYGAGASVMYKRCHYLEASDVLLAYILYTFYYKCFSMNYKCSE
jgi:hypothetical protein